MTTKQQKKNWLFNGRIELEGVDFFINNATEDEAIARAKASDWDYYDTIGASEINSHINSRTMEPNE